MVNYWIREFRRLVWVMLLFGLCGWAVDQALLFLSIGLLSYVAWTFWQLWRIREWLASPDTAQVPQSIGLWGDINDSIYSLYKAQLRERERLRQTVKYLHDSFASLSDAVVMVDSNGGIDWCNDASLKLLGLRYPEDQNQQLTNFLRAPDFVQYFDEANYEKPLEILSAIDGSTWLQFHITRFGLGNRLVFARNITTIVKSQQVRRDFLANVSHELRTPLTVITGYLDNLSMVPQLNENRALAGAVEQMRSQASRMEALVKDLTDLSRIESKPEAKLHKEIELPGLLFEAKNMVLASSKKRSEVTVDCPPGLLLYGSSKEMLSVFSNLIGNAVKYSSEPARIEITVRTREQRLLVSVKDNGMGIEAHHIPRLTERFYRVDSSRNSDTGGTGLGLAIVKHVLHRHGAELHIYSELGIGSEFVCDFPESRFKLPENGKTSVQISA